MSILRTALPTTDPRGIPPVPGMFPSIEHRLPILWTFRLTSVDIHSAPLCNTREFSDRKWSVETPSQNFNPETYLFYNWSWWYTAGPRYVPLHELRFSIPRTSSRTSINLHYNQLCNSRKFSYQKGGAETHHPKFQENYLPFQQLILGVYCRSQVCSPPSSILFLSYGYLA